MQDYDITIVRRNTPTINVTVRDGDGDLVDLTGYTMKMCIKKEAEDTDANAIAGPITATISDPTSGVGSFSLTTTHTNVSAEEYTYDVKIENASTGKVYTVVGPSVFKIVENVTKG